VGRRSARGAMILALAKYSLGPLLLAQGRHVRRTAIVLPEPPGARQGEAGEGQRLRLLVCGDSAGAGVGAATQDEALTGRIVAGLRDRFRVEYRLVAKTGATTRATIAHLEKLEAFATDAVVTSLGVNDVTGDVSVARFLEQQARLRALLREKFGARLILVSTVPPIGRFPALPQPLRWYLGARGAEYNRARERALPDGEGGEYLPVPGELGPQVMATDGFHPGPRVYQAWGGAAAERIASVFGPDGRP
jgi:lysophospholipase L1-like esterase